MLAPVKSKYRPAGQAVHRLCSCTSSDRAETNPGFSPYLPTGQFLHWSTRNNPSTSEYVPAGQFLHWVKTSVAAFSVEYLPCRRETKQTNQATQLWQLIIDAVRPTVFSALVGARRSTTKRKEVTYQMDNRDRNAHKTKKHWGWCYGGTPPCLGLEVHRCTNCTLFQCRTCRHCLEKKKRTENWQEHVRQRNLWSNKKKIATWRTRFTFGGCRYTNQVRPSTSRTWSKEIKKKGRVYQSKERTTNNTWIFVHLFTYKICIDRKMLKNYFYFHRSDLFRTFYR